MKKKKRIIQAEINTTKGVVCINEIYMLSKSFIELNCLHHQFLGHQRYVLEIKLWPINAGGDEFVKE